MPKLLSYLTISGVIASTPGVGDVPPVPELTDIADTAESDTAEAATDDDVIENSRIKIDNDTDEEKTVMIPTNSQALTGVDVASHQHTGGSYLNIENVLSGGKDFGFVKATEGTDYINPYFREDTIDFIMSDAPVGFYHYARPSTSTEDARQQAQLFVKVTGMDIGVKSLPPVLDIEESEGLSSDELIEWTHAFVDEIKDLTGRDTMIYTYPNFWVNEMGNTPEFNHLPLWIARYTDNPTPGTLPGGWEDWTFWQYSDSGDIPGSVGDIDLNVFSGDEEELEELYTTGTVLSVVKEGLSQITDDASGTADSAEYGVASEQGSISADDSSESIIFNPGH